MLPTVRDSTCFHNFLKRAKSSILRKNHDYQAIKNKILMTWLDLKKSIARNLTLGQRANNLKILTLLHLYNLLILFQKMPKLSTASMERLAVMQDPKKTCLSCRWVTSQFLLQDFGPFSQIKESVTTLIQRKKFSSKDSSSRQWRRGKPQITHQRANPTSEKMQEI